MKYETFEFFPYFKCGDDMNGHLHESKGNVSEAFASWAKQMEEGARAARRLAEITKGTDIEVQADTHTVVIENVDDKIEQILRKEELVDVVEHECPDEEE